jgi:hypothetical protein
MENLLGDPSLSESEENTSVLTKVCSITTATFGKIRTSKSRHITHVFVDPFMIPQADLPKRRIPTSSR